MINSMMTLAGAAIIATSAVALAQGPAYAAHNAQHGLTLQAACEGYVESGHFDNVSACMKEGTERQREWCVTLENKGAFKDNPRASKNTGECIRHLNGLPVK
jgi:homoserine kinase